jgi:hypothetical protein
MYRPTHTMFAYTDSFSFQNQRTYKNTLRGTVNENALMDLYSGHHQFNATVRLVMMIIDIIRHQFVTCSNGRVGIGRIHRTIVNGVRACPRINR